MVRAKSDKSSTKSATTTTKSKSDKTKIKVKDSKNTKDTKNKISKVKSAKDTKEKSSKVAAVVKDKSSKVAAVVKDNKSVSKKSVKSSTKSTSEPTVPRSHRFRPGTVALREIRRFQKSTDLLMPRLPFHKLVREVAQEMNQDKSSKMQFQLGALVSVQEATEHLLMQYLEDANFNAIHANRITVQPQDLLLVQRQRHELVQPCA